MEDFARRPVVIVDVGESSENEFQPILSGVGDILIMRKELHNTEEFLTFSQD